MDGSDSRAGGDNKRLVAALNDLLEAEFIALVHYVQHAGCVRGLTYHSVVGWLRNEATAVMDHAITLTQTILSLGGVPEWEVGRSHPFGQSASAYDVRRLLAHDLDHGRQLAGKYGDAIALAAELGEAGVKVMLEQMLADEQRTMQAIERMTETP